MTDEAGRTVLRDDIPHIRAVARELGMNEKRAAYICEKWESKGWLEYGVCALAGWLTEAGMDA